MKIEIGEIEQSLWYVSTQLVVLQSQHPQLGEAA